MNRLLSKKRNILRVLQVVTQAMMNPSLAPVEER